MSAAASSGDNAERVVAPQCDDGVVRSETWTPAIFLDRAQELRRRLLAWHVHNPIESIWTESLIKTLAVIRWTFRDVIFRGEHGPKPTGGQQIISGLVSKGTAVSNESVANKVVGTILNNLPSETDQNLTRWLLRDYWQHVPDAGSSSSAEYLRLAVERILDAPIYCARPSIGNAEQRSLDQENANRDDGPYSFIGGRKLEPSLLVNLVTAAERLLITPSPTPVAQPTVDGSDAGHLSLSKESSAPEPKPPTLTKADKAYLCFHYAQEKAGRELKTDRDAHDWLLENGTPLDDYELPDFGTWTRYLRTAREARGEQKNSRRAGRATGKSVIRLDEA